MPLPKDADQFLDVAFKAAKKGAAIHLYLFLDKEEFDAGKKRVADIAAENKVGLKITGMVRCGQYSPSIFRMCLDMEILKR